jgi:hypothetical protein
MALSYNVNQRDFGYRRSGDYTNAPALTLVRRRSAVRRDAGTGKVCVGCGLTRSLLDVCDCNAK